MKEPFYFAGPMRRYPCRPGRQKNNNRAPEATCVPFLSQTVISHVIEGAITGKEVMKLLL